MQKKVNFFQLFLFLPVLFWLVANPISLFSAENKVVKTDKKYPASKKESIPETIVKAEQPVYQVSSNLQLDFPTDWAFQQISIPSFQETLHAFKLPITLPRAQILSILFTQFIATLAP
ncbi:hypothetical protein EWU23_11930 [Cytophagaceae bacterium 50C-KIRBA]|uniref:Uncharacterized protein n=1 Tax=Aquirufa beregesia TaxID=2516556 RepID=A0ABX0EXK8_9BACT|nr:hypothetical protein [Aquirufa beregesia]NGZ45184.1 hypothetical protein [Aquirufa beregesia]